MDSVLNEPGSGATVASFNSGVWTGPALTTTPVGSITDTIVNLGQDLSNDHPIGVQYGGGGLTVGTPGGATKDPDFKATSNEVINGTTIWWVDTGTAGRQKTDLQLYTRTDTTAAGGTAIAGGAQPYVECASCHDPHTTNDTFLRVSNAGSTVCLACHNK
jgi:predicted CXXCH cytochrome family protein